MTIDVSAAIVISVLSLAFSVFMGVKNNKRSDTKDIEERVKDNTKINMKNRLNTQPAYPKNQKTPFRGFLVFEIMRLNSLC